MYSLKQIGTLLLCGLLFMRVMIAPVIFFSYELNKDYIIKNYCVNKNRPQLNCEGKCYLAKKLQAAQEKEENQSKITVYKLLLEFFHQNADLSDKQLVNILLDSKRAYYYHNHYYYICIFSLLKPPQG